MNDTFQCGDPGSLVAYLYDECEPGERELIAAHITRCAACASEIDTLGATRQALSAWAPPDMALGFQITRVADAAPAADVRDADQTASVLVPKIAWWRAPLPAWAQAAAAVVIFATGVSVGVGRNMTSGQTSREAGSNPGATTTVAASPTTGVSRDELAQLEQRLKSEMSQMRTVSTTPAPARSADAVMAEVRALIDQSNAEQNREITLRLVDLESDFELRNRRMAESFGQLQGAVRTEVGQQRRAFEGLLRNVSDQR